MATAVIAGPARDVQRCRPASPCPRISAIRPAARPIPSPRPSTLPTRRSISASIRIVRVTQPAGGAERTQRADLAHALQHGHVERVEDQEPADEQRDAREEVEDEVERRSSCCLTSSPKPCGVLTFAPGPSARAQLPLHRLDLSPGRRRATLTCEVARRDADERPARGDRHRGEALAAEGQPARRSGRCRPRGSARRPARRGDAEPVAGREAACAGPVALERDLAARRAACARRPSGSRTAASRTVS